MSLVEGLRYNKRMGDFIMHCVGVIKGIWGGYEFLAQFLVPVLILSVHDHVVELSNQVYELKNAVNALKEGLEDDDSEGYTTEED